MSKSAMGFVFGGICGAVAGFAVGVLLAPRSGAESRAMAADAMNDAWDSAVDTYERGSQAVTGKFGNVRPNMDAATDELRAKVDLARERMDQLRESLSGMSANVAEPTQASDVNVEPVEEPASAVEPTPEPTATEPEPASPVEAPESEEPSAQ